MALKKLRTKTDAILEKLSLEGRVTVFDSPEDLLDLQKVNQYMERLHRETKVKQFFSEQEAAKIILTA